MDPRAGGLTVMLLATLACADRGAIGGEEESGTEGEVLSELCMAAIDPQTYADGPVLEPTPVVADAECPPLGEAFAVELPAPVQITGTVWFDGAPTGAAFVQFQGRVGEGTVDVYPEDDGAFICEVLPGRYDIYVRPYGVISNGAIVLEDVELTTATQLMIEAPVAVTVTGTLTMDGEPAPDLFGYVLFGGKPLYMLDGTYELRVTPGTYTLSYGWCDPADVGADFDYPFCVDVETPPIPPDAPRIGPEQESVTLTSVDIEQDMVLDIDVPTARLSGQLELDGPPLDGVMSLQLRELDVGLSQFSIAEDGSFDLRLVQAGYAGMLTRFIGPVPEITLLGKLDQDRHVEINRVATTLRAPVPTDLPLADDWVRLYLERPDPSWDDDWWSWDGESWLERPIWPGPWKFAVLANYCWPDAELGQHAVDTVLHSELEVTGPTTLDTELEFAAVHIDLVELGERPIMRQYDGPCITLEPEVDTPSSGALRFCRAAAQPELDIHGYLVPGRYRVTYADGLLGSFELAQGTTLSLRLPTRDLDFHLTLGGEVVDSSQAADRMGVFNIDTDEAIGEAEEGMLTPGRYAVRYFGPSYAPDDGWPDNEGVPVGCFTVEG